jgi:hypothetical protein
MNRKVTRAKFHEMAIVVEGVGTIDKELPSKTKNYPLEMWIDSTLPTALFAKIKGVEFCIPLANVQVFFLDTSPSAPTVTAQTPLKVAKAS